MNDFASLANSDGAQTRWHQNLSPSQFFPIRIQPAEVLTKVHPVAAKKEEERPLLVETKEVKEEASRRQQQILKEEEEKENRVGRKKEQKTHPWRRSFVVAPMK